MSLLLTANVTVHGVEMKIQVADLGSWHVFGDMAGQWYAPDTWDRRQEILEQRFAKRWWTAAGAERVRR